MKIAATRAGALGGAIGRNVKEFFRTKLPEAASTIHKSITQQSIVAKNKHLDQPFDDATAKGIIEKLNAAREEDDSLRPIDLKLPNSNSDDHPTAAWIFFRDLGARIGQFKFNGQNVSDKTYSSASGEFGSREQDIDFYNCLKTGDASDKDIYTISTVCNQSLFGVFQAHCYTEESLRIETAKR